MGGEGESGTGRWHQGERTVNICKLYGQWIGSGYCDGKLVIARAPTRAQAERAWMDKARERMT